MVDTFTLTTDAPHFFLFPPTVAERMGEKEPGEGDVGEAARRTQKTLPSTFHENQSRHILSSTGNPARCMVCAIAALAAVVAASRPSCTRPPSPTTRQAS